MSRVITRTPISQPPQTPQPKKDNTTLILPATKILNFFFKIKQRQQYRASFIKIKKISVYNKKRAAYLGALLQGTFSRKTKLYLNYSWVRLVAERDSSVKLELESIENKKNNVKSKSAIFMAMTYKRLSEKRLKDVFSHLIVQTKQKAKLDNFRNRFISRVFESLTLKQLKLGYGVIKDYKFYWLKRKSILSRIARLIQAKKQSNISAVFTKILLAGPKKEAPGPAPKTEPIKNSRVKPAIPQKQPDPIPQSSQKKRDLQTKTKKLEQQLNQTTKKNQQQLAEYKTQIAKLQAEHESRKFNSQILDQAIRQLQNDIIQRQKKSRKGMPISEIWEKVYSNFLLLLNQYAGQVLPKEKVLEFLETPLVPINVNIAEIQSENQVLTELLAQYRKFFQGTELPQKNEDILLPYDILITKNKFLYQALETLIKQGLGAQTQVKQLETDLDNLIKQA